MIIMTHGFIQLINMFNCHIDFEAYKAFNFVNLLFQKSIY